VAAPVGRGEAAPGLMSKDDILAAWSGSDDDDDADDDTARPPDAKRYSYQHFLNRP
jgi:hypothetical protein